ncbi:hypothetical protein [Paenibacillus sp. MMS20-IR301]|uniref:GNAT family N-acetyltransferase n=1 Tax=Paenibacillus sp. MMS20-IR301 TaxID=2895946 RepID=UPI0028EC7266|nr:hypothetical protein [Paenibacillus sp. MMS20-IR301]WNS40941.1 hypothetical protein LOS79_18000 [Paenibacillus sp. MMS20-IR301]
MLPDFVRIQYPGAEQIVLAVNERNTAARQLYLRAGFQDNGLRRSGSKGPQMILQYKLAPKPAVPSA